MKFCGGAGLVGAVHRGDRQVGQGGAGVVGGDRRVVPLGDLPVEDLRDGGRSQLEVGHALHVVDHRDRRDVGRHLDHVAVAAGLGLGQLLVLERGVAAGEGHPAAEELVAAGTGAARVVGDVGVRVGRGEAGDPRLLGRLLGAGARAGDRAGDRGRRAGRSAATAAPRAAASLAAPHPASSRAPAVVTPTAATRARALCRTVFTCVLRTSSPDGRYGSGWPYLPHAR